MSYQFLLFDLDHTLLDFAADEDAALTALLVEAGVTAIQDYKDYYVPMNKALWEDLNAGKLAKVTLINTRFAKLFEHFGVTVDGSYLAGRYEHFLSQQGHLLPGAEALVKSLIRDGYRLFAVTNGVTAIQKGRLKTSGFDRYFEQVFISDEIGFHKPDKAVFEVINRQVEGFDKHQAIMIGDSLTSDIQGGTNAGIDTIWFNPDRKTNTTDIVPTYEVDNYESLLEVLKRS